MKQTEEPKGLIVDFGGVLTTSIFDSFAAFYESQGIDPRFAEGVLREAAREDGLMHQIETGSITEQEFNRLLADALSKGLETPVDPEGLKERMFAQVGPDPEMVQTVGRIKASGFSTALLSNSWGSSGDYPRQLLDELFDAVVISGEVGLRKPDPKIYLMAAELIHLDPSDCVFVDDIRRNVEGAEAVGMRGVHHVSTPDTIRALEGLFEPEGARSEPG